LFLRPIYQSGRVKNNVAAAAGIEFVFGDQRLTLFVIKLPAWAALSGRPITCGGKKKGK